MKIKGKIFDIGKKDRGFKIIEIMIRNEDKEKITEDLENKDCEIEVSNEWEYMIFIYRKGRFEQDSPPLSKKRAIEYYKNLKKMLPNLKFCIFKSVMNEFKEEINNIPVAQKLKSDA